MKNYFLSIFNLNKKSNSKQVSFEDLYDLTSLPLIIVEIGGKSFIFLLDSGSNTSLITPSLLPEIKGHYRSKSDKRLKMAGSTGEPETHSMKRVRLDIGINDVISRETLTVQDIPAFHTIEEETGTKVQGVLGNDFFLKHSAIINFNNLTFSLEDASNNNS